MASSDRRREAGSALFIAVMMLVLMGALGIVALNEVTTDRQVAGVQNRAVSAFYSAEAGLAEARSLVKDIGTRTSTLISVSVGVNGIGFAKSGLPIVVPAHTGAPVGLADIATMLAASSGSTASIVDTDTGSPKSWTGAPRPSRGSA